MKKFIIDKEFTDRSDPSTQKYLNEIKRIPLIDVYQEKELACKRKSGDPLASNKLAEANLRFVFSIAKKYQHNGLLLGDLINEGNRGLLKASKKFDETHDVKFTSYAVSRIRQSIILALGNTSRVVRLPLSKISSISKIEKAIQKLEQKYEREPMPEEIADEFKINIEEVKNYFEIKSWHLSIDSPFTEGEDNTLLGILENNDEPKPDDFIINESVRKKVNQMVNGLKKKRYRDVLIYYFGLDGKGERTLNQISEITGVPYPNVCKDKLV